MPPACTASLADTIVRLLEERLTRRTREHSLAAALLMEEAALDLDLDPARARLTGLSHDLAKGMSGAEMLSTAIRWGLPVTEYQRNRPKMLHGPLAAHELTLLGVRDPDIHEAISWHTTGKPGLSTLGLLLFFADFAEPGREFSEAPEARKIFRKHGLLRAVLFAAESKAGYAARKAPLDPMTLEFTEWLRLRIKESVS